LRSVYLARATYGGKCFFARKKIAAGAAIREKIDCGGWI
jgi:hypothetical protein